MAPLHDCILHVRVGISGSAWRGVCQHSKHIVDDVDACKFYGISGFILANRNRCGIMGNLLLDLRSINVGSRSYHHPPIREESRATNAINIRNTK